MCTYILWMCLCVYLYAYVCMSVHAMHMYLKPKGIRYFKVNSITVHVKLSAWGEGSVPEVRARRDGTHGGVAT